MLSNKLYLKTFDNPSQEQIIEEHFDDDRGTMSPCIHVLKVLTMYIYI